MHKQWLVVSLGAVTESRTARDAGNELLSELAEAFPEEWNVSVGRMFNGPGLRAGGKFFAFVNSAGWLVVKLAAPDVQRFVDSGEGSQVRMGKRTMREWVSLPQPHNGDLARWRDALEAAHEFALEQSGPPEPVA